MSNRQLQIIYLIWTRSRILLVSRLSCPFLKSFAIVPNRPVRRLGCLWQMWPNIFPVAICSQWIDVFKFLKTDEFYWTSWKIIYWHIFIIFSIPFHDKNKGYVWHFFHFCHKQPNVELVHSFLTTKQFVWKWSLWLNLP